MLLDFKSLYQKYNMNVRGIITVGSHELEELNLFKELGIQKRVWIEANPKIVKWTKLKYPDEQILNGVVSDEDNKITTFNITNNLASSSLLELGTHTWLHPDIYLTETITINTVKLPTLLARNNINIEDYNLLNIDTQGAEGMVLKGSDSILDKIDYIYVEVNTQEVYKGCSLINEVDNILKTHGLTRKELSLFAESWGDALYVR